MEPMQGIRALFGFLAAKRSALNRILLEKASNESGVEVCSHLDDRPFHKATNLAVSVVESKPVLSGSFRTQFDHRPVTADEHVFHKQLRTFR